MILYSLARHGTVFSTRERGAEIRGKIEAAIRQSDSAEELVLDFSEVDLISFSFADETVGRLIVDRRAGNLGVQAILITNAIEDVLDPIERSLERRGLVGAYLEGKSIRLLNGAPHLQVTFDAARLRAEFRTAELAGDLGISVQACNNRLKQLLEAGLVSRAPGTPRSGGHEFLYRTIWQSNMRQLEVA